MSLLHLLPLVVLVAAVPVQVPAPPENAAARIRTLAQARQFDAALAAYDRAILAASNRPDPMLLAIIGREQLNEIAGGTDPGMVADARERLAAAGDNAALAALREQASSAAGAEATAASTDALLRLGDKATLDNATRLLQSAPPASRGVLIQTLMRAHATAAGPAITPFLGDESPQVRIMAAQALGALGVRSAIPSLQAMFQKDIPTVKMFAALALKKLGDTSADAFVADLLASPQPDARLTAADAYGPAQSKIWLPAVRELRSNPNEVVRVQAAERMACCDVPTARAVLLDALATPNPLLRNEAARVLEETGLADARIARRLMAEPIDALRLRGAGIALRLSRAAPAARGR